MTSPISMTSTGSWRPSSNAVGVWMCCSPTRAAAGSCRWARSRPSSSTRPSASTFVEPCSRYRRRYRCLNDGASIVLSGSSAATNGTSAFSVYAASKAAIRSFGRTWAAELAGRGIRVNTIVPGPTNTPGLSALAPDPEQAQGLLQAIAGQVPLGRLGQPEEIANAVLFLASSESSFMTGGEIFVDGGSEQI